MLVFFIGNVRVRTYEKHLTGKQPYRPLKGRETRMTYYFEKGRRFKLKNIFRVNPLGSSN